ncbi:MAG: hypothetical protein ACRENE_03565 [Polyangiaceae bacterium]
MIPAQALLSAVPSADTRGSFMSVSSSVQQISGGIASAVAGLVVAEAPGGFLLHFDVLGYIVICTSLFSLAMMRGISRLIPETPKAVAPAAAESA